MQEHKIVTYMYSTLPDQTQPLYTNGELDYQLAADYFHSFASSTMSGVRKACNCRLMSIDRFGEWGIEFGLSNEVKVIFSIANEICPMKENDEMRNIRPKRTWFVHHVCIDGIVVDDWTFCERELIKLINENKE